MGSPFFVTCSFNKNDFDDHMEFSDGSNDTMELRLEEAREVASECTWGCADGREISVARFRNRRNPGQFALLARSPKPTGGWQITWMDERGAIGDIRVDTQCEVIKYLGTSGLSDDNTIASSAVWVDGAPMSNWYLEEWL